MSQDPDKPSASLQDSEADRLQRPQPNNVLSLMPAIQPLSSVNVPANQPASSGQPEELTEPPYILGRHPRTMQQLLRAAAEIQRNENHVPPQMSPEREEYLRGALEAQMNFIPEMKRKIALLAELPSKPDSYVEDNLSMYEAIMEKIQESLFEIDVSIVFYQVNGLQALIPLLRNKHPSLRSLAAKIIVECCQNNPYCQERSLSDELISTLMTLATSDPNIEAMFHAISAISEKIAETDIIENLITLLQLSGWIVKEYVLKALVSVVRDNPRARQRCREEDLQSYLVLISRTYTDPEYESLIDCLDDLKKLLE